MRGGDVVWVPFPHVEDDRLQSRPAVVLVAGLGPFDLFWAVMITAAVNQPWVGDVAIDDHEAAGLPIPSRVRTAKLTTLAPALATPMGRLSDRTWAEVRRKIGETLTAVTSG